MDHSPTEPEDDPQEPEKPRFLLPDGCKDLVDALRLQEKQAAPYMLPSGAIVIPDPVIVRELAWVLRVKPFELIGALMELNVFASINSSIPFATAAAVCARYGIVAQRVAW
jgi:hypothetical protein